MQAVILAAGKGKRMGKLTKNTPKPMLRIKGKPILEYKIKALPKKITEVVFVVGYYSDEIMKHFKRSFDGRKISYVFQPVLNGTGGALHSAKSVLRGKFLVMMGDDLYHPKDLNNFIKNDLAILGFEVDNLSAFGVIKTDSRGNMIDVIENPKRSKFKLTNAGVYILGTDFFDYELVPKKAGDFEFGLPQTLAKMSKKHKIKVEKATLWHAITNPEDLRAAEKVIDQFYSAKKVSKKTKSVSKKKPQKRKQ